jgi:hypothetical protein
MGHEVEVDQDALASTYALCGRRRATRLAAIHRAAASGADVALISARRLWHHAHPARHCKYKKPWPRRWSAARSLSA